jgi:ketosteroid isomerase-like protein
VTATSSSDWKELRSKYGILVQKFGEMWTAGSTEEIADLFTETAVFSPSPFDTPLRGRAAITEYWQDTPLEQAEVKFRYGEVFVAGPWFATEFKCTFRRRRTGKPVDVRGALFCETADDRISEMRMYWHRVVEQ